MNTKEISTHINRAIILFALSGLAGFLTALAGNGRSQLLLREFASTFSFFAELSPAFIFLFIFLNNAAKALAAILLGFLFGIVPLGLLLINGYFIGFVVAATGERFGFGTVIMNLVPHGVFEIPAFLLAVGYGLWLGARFWKKLCCNESFGEAFSFSLKKYFSVVLPLLLLAAFIETFVTPRVADLTR